MIARHYAEEEGRWTTVDPLWMEHEIGVFTYKQDEYSFVFGNPVNLVDASGLDPRCQCDLIKPVSPIIWLPKSDPRYRCYLRACKSYCNSIYHNGVIAQQLCSNPWTCANIHSQYPPCSSYGIYHKRCGQMFTLDGGQFATEPFLSDKCAPANMSNYPKPLPQTKYCGDTGAEYCCVECKMRVCCANILIENPELHLKRQLKKCDLELRKKP